jgi:hypothetical protein
LSAKRAILERAGDEVTNTLESVSLNLTEFERVTERISHLVEGYRNRLATKEAERLILGSPEWSRAEFVLGCSEAVLRHSNQIRAENDRYRAERNPTSSEVLVGRKKNSQIIAQGRLGVVGWGISGAKAEFENWKTFMEHQQPQRKLQQPKAIDQSRSLLHNEAEKDRS